MAEIPELTHAQAAILRGMDVPKSVWDHAIRWFAEEGLYVGGVVTDLGYAAIIAYEAEQREWILREELAKALSYSREDLSKDRNFHTKMDNILNDQKKTIKAIRVEAMRDLDRAIRERVRMFWLNTDTQRCIDDVIRSLIEKEESDV